MYAGRPVTREIAMNLPAAEPKHDVLATLWARTRVDMLMHDPGNNNREEITQLGLNYRLMTPFTSFVAVEEMVVTDGGKPRRVDVPVEMPHGVSYEGVFGNTQESDRMVMTAMAPAQMQSRANSGGFVAGSVGNRVQVAPPPPPASADVSRKSAAEGAAMRDELRRELKLDPTLLKRTGKVLVQVWLLDASDAVLAKLKVLGFEMTVRPGAMKMVTGRIDVARLKALSELPAVKYVGPAPAAK
jgi:Ca-activated chloride channel family protein